MTGPAALLLDVFASVPHVLVCTKGSDGRYLDCNDAFVRRARQRHRSQVVGRRAADLFPAHLAAAYDAQDAAVLRTGRAKRNLLDLIPGPSGVPLWHLTTKVVEPDGAGSLLVVVSVVAQMGLGDRAQRLADALEYVGDHLAEPLRVAALARMAQMSVDQFDRAMHRAVGMSAKQYVVQARTEAAAALLVTTSLTLSQIAAQCGFYDQSQFTRQFKAHTGLTPGQYRAGRPPAGGLVVSRR